MDTTDPSAPPRKFLSWTEMAIIVGILGVVAAIAVPGLISSQRASNERMASTTLKSFATAEAEFRANDLDWNHVNDFWTADVKSFHTLTSAKVRGAKGGSDDPPLKLIEEAVAAADGDGTFFPAGGENMPPPGQPFPRAGYWFLAMNVDRTLDTPEMTYRQNTGGKPDMGAVHNTSKFGFVALPNLPSEGKYGFLLNENNTIFRRTAKGPLRSGTSRPPGPKAFPAEWLDWPDERHLPGED